jgi:hypothetical protein
MKRTKPTRNPQPHAAVIELNSYPGRASETAVAVCPRHAAAAAQTATQVANGGCEPSRSSVQTE